MRARRPRSSPPFLWASLGYGRGHYTRASERMQAEDACVLALQLTCASHPCHQILDFKRRSLLRGLDRRSHHRHRIIGRPEQRDALNISIVAAHLGHGATALFAMRWLRAPHRTIRARRTSRRTGHQTREAMLRDVLTVSIRDMGPVHPDIPADRIDLAFPSSGLRGFWSRVRSPRSMTSFLCTAQRVPSIGTDRQISVRTV